MTKHHMQGHFGRTFEVPPYSPIFKMGDKVTWLVEPKKRGKQSFMAMGRITRLYATTFGSRRRKQAAQVEVMGEYLKVFPGRKHTTVALDKLGHY